MSAITPVITVIVITTAIVAVAITIISSCFMIAIAGMIVSIIIVIVFGRDLLWERRLIVYRFLLHFWMVNQSNGIRYEIEWEELAVRLRDRRRKR